MLSRLLPLILLLSLLGCDKPRPDPRSLVSNRPAPKAYALAGDTITVWRRIKQADGTWRFHSYSITPGGTVEYLDELERIEAFESTEDSQPVVAERRHGFVLSPQAFTAIRAQAALLRPAALGPEDPVRGYGGEAYPLGCAADKTKPAIAGINFLNSGGWGAFVMPTDCTSDNGRAASAALDQIVDQLEQAARAPTRP